MTSFCVVTNDIYSPNGCDRSSSNACFCSNRNDSINRWNHNNCRAYAQALGNGGHGTPRTDSPTGTGQPTDPNCFGEINSGLAQSSGGVGEHASDPVPSNPGRETPRLGVGNQVEGTPGEHGLTVGPIFRQPCEAGPSSQN